MLALLLEWMLTRPSSFAELRLMLFVRALSREHFRPLSDILSGFANQHGFQFPPTASLEQKCARCREHCALMQIVNAVSHVGVIAGSFALHTFLLGSGQTPQWQATDIDVFIPAKLSTLSEVIDELQTKQAVSIQKEDSGTDDYPVGMLRAVIETVDGARDCSLHLILTDMASVTGRSIMDNFDLGCCAFACRVSNETLQFEYSDVAHARWRTKKWC